MSKNNAVLPLMGIIRPSAGRKLFPANNFAGCMGRRNYGCRVNARYTTDAVVLGGKSAAVIVEYERIRIEAA
jgi:hypothetical protein